MIIGRMKSDTTTLKELLITISSAKQIHMYAWDSNEYSYDISGWETLDFFILMNPESA